MTKYNHNRPLSDFDLETVQNNGFNPIGVSQIYFEDVYVFETDEEAEKAYSELELKKGFQAYWYSKECFLNEVSKYEKNETCKVLIHWL